MGLEADRNDLIDGGELRRLVREEAMRHRTKADFARSIDIYPSFLQNFLGGLKGPGFKILDHFGYEEVTMYRKLRR